MGDLGGGRYLPIPGPITRLQPTKTTQPDPSNPQEFIKWGAIPQAQLNSNSDGWAALAGRPAAGCGWRPSGPARSTPQAPASAASPSSCGRGAARHATAQLQHMAAEVPAFLAGFGGWVLCPLVPSEEMSDGEYLPVQLSPGNGKSNDGGGRKKKQKLDSFLNSDKFALRTGSPSCFQ